MKLSREEFVDQLMAEGLELVVDAMTNAGLRVSVWTAIRWAPRGVRVTRPEAIKLGGRWMTSTAVVRRFLGRSDSSPEPVQQHG